VKAAPAKAAARAKAPITAAQPAIKAPARKASAARG
jgi:hypothetical protein